MRPIRSIRCLSASLLTLLCALGAWAQSANPFSAYTNLVPGEESFRMTRYGNVAPSLHTGAMTFSVPIFTYTDPDFTIPLSLEYSFDGYRPAEHSGTVGYGWHLACGGAVTREIRCLPDDVPVYGYLASAKGGTYTTHSSNYFIGSTIMYLASLWAGSRAYLADQMVDVNSFTDLAVFNSLSGALNGDYGHFDSAPDIFHFSAPGLSGDFVLAPDGTAIPFNTSCPEGEVSVEFTMDYFDEASPESTITVTDGQGYQYVFGGDRSAMEYSFTTLDDVTGGTAVSWRLKRITAPNGNVAVWEYAEVPDLNLSFAYSFEPWVHHYYMEGYGLRSFKTKHSIIETTSLLLEDVKVSGHSIYSLSYAARGPSNDENALSCFSRMTQEDLSSSCAPPEYHSVLSPRSLSSITVRNHSGRVLRAVALDKSYTPGSKRMLLTGVGIPGMGRYSFTYNKSDWSAPPNDTYQTDHWGYWNKAARELDFADYINSHQVYTGLYYQVPDSVKAPDTSRTLYAALTGITYPTGGNSRIEYEQNTAGTVFDRGVGYGPSLHGSPDGFVPGGVRVSRIINESGQICDTISYKYLAEPSGPGNAESGTLSYMPRYYLEAQFDLSLANPDVLLPTRIRDGSRGDLDAIHYETYTYTYESSPVRPRGPVVSYSHVQEYRADGSRTEYSFTGFQDFPDVWWTDSGSAGGYCDFWFRHLFSLQNFVDAGVDLLSRSEAMANLLLPPLEDYSAMRGRLLSREVVDASGQTVSRETHTYSPVEAFRDTIYTNLIVSIAEQSDIHYVPRLASKYEQEHEQSRTTTYAYNARGQESHRQTAWNDGRDDITHTWYLWQQLGDITEDSSRRSAPGTVVHMRKMPDGSCYMLDHTAYTYDGPSGLSAPTGITVRRSAHPETRMGQPVHWLSAPASGYAVRTASLSYDARFRLTRADLPGGSYVTYGWDADGLHILTRTLDDPANAWTYSWDDQSGPSSVKEPSGTVTSYTYDSCGRPSEVRDTDGNLLRSHAYMMSTESGASTAPGLNAVRSDIYTAASPSSYVTDIDWYGGLGYLEQRIAVGGSASTGKDLVTPVVYDAMRRPDATVYLPFVAQGTSGAYVSDAIQEQAEWYADRDSHPWSETAYESSVAGRPLSVRREGDIYAAEDIRTRTVYGTNTAADAVLRFSWSDALTPDGQTVTRSGLWGAGKLGKVMTVGENSDTSWVFRDARGLTCLTRQVSGGVCLDTYTVRDVRDSVVCIIQPEGSALLAAGTVASFTLSGDFASRWCFTYGYDGCGNLIRTGTPGGGTADMAYDQRDRPVTYTDGVLSGNNYQRTVDYDARGRITAVKYGRTMGYAASVPVYEASYWTSSSSSTSGFMPVGGVVSLSDVSVTRCLGLLRSETLQEQPVREGTPFYSCPSGNVSVTRLHFYDGKGRLVQRRDTWSDGWVSRYSFRYDFLGNVLVCDERHTSPDGTTDSLRTSSSYDARGRLLSQVSVCDGVTLRSTFSYDELGRLVSSGTDDGAGGPALCEYRTYDIHGWPRSASVRVDTASTLWSESLLYEDGPCPRFGGSVSGQENAFGGITGGFTWDYRYDGAGRLVSSSLSHGGSAVGGESMTYDRNGGLLELERISGSGVPPSSHLVFTRNGNRLSSLSGTPAGEGGTYAYDADGRMTSDGRAGRGVSYTAGGYPYKVTDASGSLQAVFHYLGDDTKVAVRTAGGEGWKYRGSFIYKMDPDGSQALESVSCPEGRFVMDGPILRGRRYVCDHLGGAALVVDMDALGAGSGPGAVREQDLYLPFGLRYGGDGLASDPENRWHFALKEEQSGVSALPYLDFGARLYDPVIASWTTPDPLAGRYPSINPYAYCANNPVNLADPDGEKIVFVHGFPHMGAKPGRSYWGERFINKAMSTMQDKHSDVAEYDYNPFSSARQRRKQGYKYARNNIDRLTSGMDEGESFKFVSHSMGAAFSEGMADFLRDNGYEVDIMVHLSPFQAKDIQSSGERDEVLTIDFQTKGDPVLKLGFFSQGDIQGADFNIRKEASHSLTEINYIHTETLSISTWEEIQEIVSNFLNR